MKKTTKLLALLFLLSFTFGCGDDDDPNPPQVNNNEAIINGNTYQINSASLGLDAGPPYNNQFSLVFTDDLINVNSSNDFAVSTNTTMGIVIFTKLGSTALSTEQAVVNNITTTTHNLNDDTRAITNITNYTNIYTYSGVQYGDVDETGVNHFDMNNTGSGTVTINSISIDLAARTGMVDCDFSFLDENGIQISGNFNGPLKIHDDN